MSIRMGTSLTVLIVFLVLCSGCSTLSTDYGQSRGMIGRTSLNGFGAFRSTYANAGFQCRDASRLSDRVMRSDTIVWTPKVLGPIDTESTKWFDHWLESGGKTLVYIVPDSGSEAEYWVDAAQRAPPKQRLEYRKQAAKSVNEQMAWRINRELVQDSGWFDVKPLEKRYTLKQLDGVWATELAIDDSNPTSSLTIELAIDESTTNPTAATATPGLFNTLNPTGPTAGSINHFPFEAKSSETLVTIESRLKSENGSTIVAEVHSDNWDDSRIVVVAGGSLLTNYAFSKPLNRRLAEKIVDLSTPTANEPPRAAFITSHWSMIPVVESKPDVPRATGMELLTVWPISLITMHGLMLVLIIGLALLPIFGRPKRIQTHRQHDFGDHLDAVAALMNKAGGEEFARGRIREYRKRMHGESVAIPNTTQPRSNEESR